MIRITNGTNKILVSLNSYENMFKPLGFTIVTDDEDVFEEKHVILEEQITDEVVKEVATNKPKNKKAKK